MTPTTSSPADTNIKQFERAITLIETAYKEQSAGLGLWSKLDGSRTEKSEPDSLLHLQTGLRIVAASLRLACDLIQYHGAASKVAAEMRTSMDGEFANIDATLAAIGLDGRLLRKNVEENRKAHEDAQANYGTKVEALNGLFSILSKRYWAIVGPLKARDGGKHIGFC